MMNAIKRKLNLSANSDSIFVVASRTEFRFFFTVVRLNCSVSFCWWPIEYDKSDRICHSFSSESSGFRMISSMCYNTTRRVSVRCASASVCGVELSSVSFANIISVAKTFSIDFWHSSVFSQKVRTSNILHFIRSKLEQKSSWRTVATLKCGKLRYRRWIWHNWNVDHVT